MLTWAMIIDRIKMELSLPDQFLEKTDEELIDFLKKTVIPKISRYCPSKNRILLDPADPHVKTQRFNEYKIIDPENRVILALVSVYFNNAERYYFGHPLRGVVSYGSIPEYQLQSNVANDTIPWSIFSYTFEFIYPNILRVSPNLQNPVTVEYERYISEDLEDLRADIYEDFFDLCLGYVMINIGRLRKRYNTISTPFGEINLNADALLEEGMAIVARVSDKLSALHLPNIIIDRG